MSIGLEELCRRIEKLEEAHDYQKKHCTNIVDRTADRLAEGATTLVEHEVSIKHLCRFKDRVGDDIEKIQGEQNVSKNYLIAILISLVVASIMLALNLIIN